MTTTINKEPLRRINAMKDIITIALEQTDEEIFSPIRRARDRCGHTAKEKANFTLGACTGLFQGKAISRKSGRKRRIAQQAMFQAKSANFSARRKVSLSWRKTRIGWRTISTRSFIRRTSHLRMTTLERPPRVSLSPKARLAVRR
jgi:hypothetical protein